MSDVHDIPEIVQFHVDWGGVSRTSLLHFFREILTKIAYRLFLGPPHIGGRLSSTSIVDGSTEIEKNGHMFRTHPSYSKREFWYDWTYFS